jgi:riboflavin biosynthesis pyrimidine reductase
VIEPIFGLAKAAGALNPKSLAAAYGNWSGIRSNHVITQSGKFWGSDGSSRSISSSEDRELLLEIRSRTDLILVDAATARLEQYRTPRSGARLAIFSLAGDFDGIPAIEDQANPVFLFSSAAGRTEQTSSKNVSVQIGSKPFEGFQSWANSNGFGSILLEAGPTLTALAFEAGVVGQSAITRTPIAASETAQTQRNPFDGEAVLVSFAQSEDHSFSLWTH